MAKVKSSDSKRQIAQPTSNKPQAKSNGKDEVRVMKNGIERTFARSIWDHLPAGKEGFQEIVDKPDIPDSATKDQNQAPDTKPADNAQSPNYDEAVKAYTEAFGEAPGQDLTIEEILAKVTEKKGAEGNG